MRRKPSEILFLALLKGLRTARSRAAVLCVLLAILPLACSPSGDSQQLLALEEMNVLLIVIDTVGIEHLGCFHPGLQNSPHIDELASQGVLFRRAFSPSPWTQPAVASLFTSLMPSEHRILRIFTRLQGKHRTLAELMSERGLKTGAVVSHLILMRKFGFAQGFATFDEGPVADEAAITSHCVTDAAIAQLDALAGERFFLFVHYFDPHYAYNHHPAHDLTSWYSGTLQPGMSIQDLRNRRYDLSQEDISYLVGLYREEIAYTDQQVGRLLAHLAELGLTDSTLVVLTADHGEEFMRHGWIGHTRTLYDELLHVPLIFSMPGTIAPQEVDAQVSIVDIMPTLMELSRRPERESGWAGISLVKYLAGAQETPPDRELFAEVAVTPDFGDDEGKRAFKAALLSGDLKLIHDVSSGQWELYDRHEDPQELANLCGDGHPALASMQQTLLHWESGRVKTWGVDLRPATPPDPEMIRKMRALGYLD